ncbi:MAG TPA: hypothetical protein VIY49_07460 [Bryobacteraceae bacterium]
MANPAPAPPMVYGPIYTTSTQINVDNVLPNSTVHVYASGISAPVGTANTTESGSIWVPVTTKLLVAGQQITATQTYTGTDVNILSVVAANVASEPSHSPVPILETPDPLPAPVFDSGLCTYMDWVQMGGLIPGATLTITLQNPGSPPPPPTVVVNGTVAQSVQWFQLASSPIDVGAKLSASQSGLGSKASGDTPSDAIKQAPPLQPPVISPLPMACETSLSFSNMQPGADLDIINNVTNKYLDETSPGQAYYLSPLPTPLQAGPSSAKQYFVRGPQVTPAQSDFTVLPASPKLPALTYPLCQDVTELMVSDVVRGENLVLTISYTSKTTGKPVPDQPLTACAVSGRGPAPSPIPLPSSWYPTDADPSKPVTVQIVGLLCDVKSLPSSVPVVQPPRASGPPTLQKPLYPCATSVFVNDAQPGSQIQVLSGSGLPGTPIAYPVPAMTPDFAISLYSWSPLTPGEQVFVTQQGCNAFPNSLPAVSVSATAPKLPVPQVAGNYVLTTATSVLVNDVVPGAQVTLLLSGEPISPTPVDSIQFETGPPSGTPPLVTVSVPVGSLLLKAAGDLLTAGQTLCGVSAFPSPGQGGGVTVLAPVPAPSDGLNGSSNYFFTTSGCQNLLDLSVTISVTEDIVYGSTTSGTPTPGFSFQWNCYSPQGKTSAFQQYVIALVGTELSGVVNTYTAGGTPIILPGGEYQQNLVSVPSAGVLPKGYSLTIQLSADASLNINTVTWQVSISGVPVASPPPLTLTSLPGITEADLAPIVAFTLDLVGPQNFEAVVLTSGAGFFTYSGDPSPLTVVSANPYPACSQYRGGTGEHSTSSYGELPASPGDPFTQSFSVSGTTPKLVEGPFPRRALRLSRRG